MVRDDEKPLCRDYLRNLCSRGDSCRYKHPDKKFIFCHDYQNGRCRRDDCVYIHCSRDDEDHYKQTGELPPHLTELPMVNHINSEVPVCKDFMKGGCSRVVCKFRHMSSPRIRDNMNHFSEPEFKRRRVESIWEGPGPGPGPSPAFFNRYEEDPRPSLWALEEENNMLRKTIADLRKRVDDLQATNEFLLEQNAQMRINDKVSAGITAVTVPTVTLTNAPQLAPQQVNGTALRAVAANVATVPVSIAAVAATPVSLGTVSMAGVQIPAPVVTMAAHHAAAHHGRDESGEAGGQGGPPAPGQPSAPNAPQPSQLVSYPLVARSIVSLQPTT